MNEPESHEIVPSMGPMDLLLGSVSYNDADGKTHQLRTSARVFKKMKFDLSSAAVEKKEKKEEVKPDDIAKQENKKSGNPFWTSEEKKMFFEALNEYGKDFESIHMYISTRLKKKGLGDDAIKTKHQVRHFYYKTFHHLYSFLKFSEKIPKNVQELYTLINYGEIRKKTGSVSKKNWAKLNDLIAHGSMSTRVKGKTVKIKTPMCRALRRLNQLDEKYDDLKLPTRVLVELKPKDMASFVRVQSMAQNPRIKVALSLQKRLSSLITCINTRWKSTEAVVYDKALISTNPTTKDCVPEQKEIGDNSLLLNPLLRITPPRDAHVELPSIDISEYFTGQSISLNAFETRKCVKTKDELETSDKSKENGNEGGAVDGMVPKTGDEAVTIISTNHVNAKSIEEKQAKIEQIRQGWTLENCSSLTIGEIYLMLGSDSKLFLEYSWDDLVKSQDESDKQGLSNSLKKLLSLAKLQSDKVEEVKCTCGHVCGTKSSAPFKKPLPAKVGKKQQVHEVTHEIKDEVDKECNKAVPKVCNASSPITQLFHQRDRLNPKMKVRGRGLFKQLVVERKLVPNESERNHQIVSMNIITQDDSKSNDHAADGSSALELPVDGGSKVTEEQNFSGILGDNISSSGMSTGIAKLLEEGDNQWIESGVTDFSLSSLLGQFECTTKSNQSMINIGNNDIQMPQDVDAQLHTLLIESSVDYTAKFADLAQVIDNTKKQM